MSHYASVIIFDKSSTLCDLTDLKHVQIINI